MKIEFTKMITCIADVPDNWFGDRFDKNSLIEWLTNNDCSIIQKDDEFYDYNQWHSREDFMEALVWFVKQDEPVERYVEKPNLTVTKSDYETFLKVRDESERYWDE